MTFRAVSVMIVKKQKLMHIYVDLKTSDHIVLMKFVLKALRSINYELSEASSVMTIYQL